MNPDIRVYIWSKMAIAKGEKFSSIQEISFGIIDDIRNDKNLYKLDDIKCKALSIHDDRIIKSHDCNKTRENGKYNFVDADIAKSLNDYIGENYKEILKNHNFVVAGGLFTSYRYAIHDVDIFIIGKDNIKERIESFIKSIDPTKIWFSNNCMTLFSEYVPIQIILKYYDNILDLLNDFDLGSSMICYDGDNILTNGEGKFALETGYNIVNLAKYRHSYKTRLHKYNKRGFGILHTNLKYEYGFSLHYDDEINVIDDMKVSAYEACVKYELSEQIMLTNIKNIQKDKKHLCIDVTDYDLMADNFDVKITDDIFKLFRGPKIDNIYCELNKLKLLTDSEIYDILKSIIEDLKNDTPYHPYMRKILCMKFDELTQSLTMPYEIKYGLENPLSKPDEIDGFYNEGAYVDHSDIKIALK